MQNRGKIYFLFLIICCISFFVYNSAQQVKTYKALQNRSVKKNVIVKAKSLPHVATQIIEVSDLDSFKNQIEVEIEHSSLGLDDPDEAELRLNKLAAQLNFEKINYLKKILTDDSNRKKRLLACELLSLQLSEDTYKVLSQFVKNENFKEGSDIDFELTLKAKAIEGLANLRSVGPFYKTMQEIMSNTRFSFLHERAQKTLQYSNEQNNLETDVKAIRGL